MVLEEEIHFGVFKELKVLKLLFKGPSRIEFP
jgi:hypothetical protein